MADRGPSCHRRRGSCADVIQRAGCLLQWLCLYERQRFSKHLPAVHATLCWQSTAGSTGSHQCRVSLWPDILVVVHGQLYRLHNRFCQHPLVLQQIRWRIVLRVLCQSDEGHRARSSDLGHGIWTQQRKSVHPNGAAGVLADGHALAGPAARCRPLRLLHGRAGYPHQLGRDGPEWDGHCVQQFHQRHHTTKSVQLSWALIIPTVAPFVGTHTTFLFVWRRDMHKRHRLHFLSSPNVDKTDENFDPSKNDILPGPGPRPSP